MGAGLAGAYPLAENEHTHAHSHSPGWLIQFHALYLTYPSPFREELLYPGFPNRCCWLATLYQFPHEEPARRSSRDGEYGGINLD